MIKYGLAGMARQLCTWQARRVKDTYSQRAAVEGLRNRAAYKLMELNDKFRFLKRDSYVVDLGSAPGGFASVVAKTVRLDERVCKWNMRGKSEVARSIGRRKRRRAFGKLVCVDVEDMKEISGATFIRGSIEENDMSNRIAHALQGNEADVIVCDAAPSTTGDRERDHVRSVQLATSALSVVDSLLTNGGTLVIKIFRGGDEAQFAGVLDARFVRSKAVKPKASVKQSREMYYVCERFVPRELSNGPGLTSEQVDAALSKHTSSTSATQ